MRKIQGEDDKKHGDKLHSLIERTGGGSSLRKRAESRDDDEALPRDDDDEPMLLRDDDDDPALLQDDDDEDALNDDIEIRRDFDESE